MTAFYKTDAEILVHVRQTMAQPPNAADVPATPAQTTALCAYFGLTLRWLVWDDGSYASALLPSNIQRVSDEQVVSTYRWLHGEVPSSDPSSGNSWEAQGGVQ